MLILAGILREAGLVLPRLHQVASERLPVRSGSFRTSFSGERRPERCERRQRECPEEVVFCWDYLLMLSHAQFATHRSAAAAASRSIRCTRGPTAICPSNPFAFAQPPPAATDVAIRFMLADRGSCPLLAQRQVRPAQYHDRFPFVIVRDVFEQFVYIMTWRISPSNRCRKSSRHTCRIHKLHERRLMTTEADETVEEGGFEELFLLLLLSLTAVHALVCRFHAGGAKCFFARVAGNEAAASIFFVHEEHVSTVGGAAPAQHIV